MKRLASFGTRWEETFLRAGTLEIHFDWKDLCIGVFIAKDAVYVCPLPTLVFRFSRGSKQGPMSYLREAMTNPEKYFPMESGS